MSITSIGLVHYLLASAILFAVGLAIVIIRRNAVVVLMGLELILNAAALNFIAFSRYGAPASGAIDHLAMHPQGGHIYTLFIIVIAAAEAAVALAIVLNIFKNFKTVQVDEIDTLKE